MKNCKHIWKKINLFKDKKYKGVIASYVECSKCKKLKENSILYKALFRVPR